MAHIHHFAYGFINPVLGFVLAFLGSLLSLVLAARARGAKRWSRARWLVMSALALGGTGIWLMHFMAILGFDVPDTVIRYDPFTTAASFVLAVVIVAIGLFIAVFPKRTTVVRVVAAGIVTGIGVAAMHYTGMSAVSFSGTVSYDPTLVGASFAIAIVAATVALWFATMIQGASATIAAAMLMAVAVCSMHYTGMAAVRIELSTEPASGGMGAFELLAPIAVLACVLISSLAYATVGFTVRRENDQEEAMLAHARKMYETAAMVPADSGRHK